LLRRRRRCRLRAATFEPFSFPDAAPLLRLKVPQERLREKAKFASRFKLIWPVQMPSQKYFTFVFPEIDVSSQPFRT
jgi:hypothetical protein